MPVSKGYSEVARKLGVSRQRVWSMMKAQDGKCRICGKDCEQYFGLCDDHAEIDRELRNRRNAMRRK